MTDRYRPVQAQVRRTLPPTRCRPVPALDGTFGPRIMALPDRLAAHSDLPGALSCTYLTPAHRSAAKELAQWMQAAGMTVEIDGVANVVGRYPAAQPPAKTVIVGSHYDT